MLEGKDCSEKAKEKPKEKPKNLNPMLAFFAPIDDNFDPS